MIDPTAVIDNCAKIGENVEIGPFSVIGPDVVIGSGTTIASHVVINGPTTIGKDNRIYQFSSIGESPQDKKFTGENDSTLNIGNNNTIREFCSINRGTAGGGGKTQIGHVTIDDYVTLGGFTGVHQFCAFGKYSFSAIASVIKKDVPPFLIVSGNTAKPGGLNRVGLERHGMNKNRLNILRKAYKIVYREGLLLKDALVKLENLSTDSEDVTLFLEFIKSSKRGIIR